MQMTAIEATEGFRPHPYRASRPAPAFLGSTAPRLASRPGRRSLSGPRMGQLPAAIRANLQAPASMPRWAVYSASALLVVGGVVGLIQEQKTPLEWALSLASIGIGGYLFMQTLND